MVACWLLSLGFALVQINLVNNGCLLDICYSELSVGAFVIVLAVEFICHSLNLD
jgi:hypothetical protein